MLWFPRSNTSNWLKWNYAFKKKLQSLCGAERGLWKTILIIITLHAWELSISRTCVHSCLAIRVEKLTCSLSLLSAHRSHLQGCSGALHFSPSPPSLPPSPPFLLHVRAREHAVWCGSISSEWMGGWGWGEGLLLAHTGHEASQPDGDLLEWITMNPVIFLLPFTHALLHRHSRMSQRRGERALWLI